MERQRAIRSAWEAFLDGQVPRGLPQAVISSWERSRALGVDAERSEAPLAREPEIFRRRSQNAELLQAARPALERSGLFLAEASSMMIVTDASGFIIEVAGDPRVIDAGHRNHLEIGGRWEEGAIGTNAIGTALTEGRPIQIHGAEHFCEDVQRWTCAAKPVRHPLDAELLGVIDISGPANAFNPQSLALAVAIGQEIEASLGRAAKAEHEVLLRFFISKRSIWLSEEILVIDRRGFIVHGAERVHLGLDAASPADVARELRHMVKKNSPEVWRESCGRRFPNASLEVVRDGDRALGCLVVLRRPRGGRATPARARPSAEPLMTFAQILGDSPVMQEARERARRLAANTLPVLIEGETGVGKELFARAIHAASAAADGPFVPVNCGGLPRDLIASELFGYAKGAFTGADEHGRAGKIEMADGGVLCLDEIGEMPLELQSYLLRVLEDGVVYRVGSHEGHRTHIRLLSMTNRDVASEVAGGRFRRDLYYRIAAARVRIPPLRERGEDILLLAERFAAIAADRLGLSPPRFSSDVQSLLRSYHWPGNVRELRNVVDTMVALANSERLEVEDLPEEIRSPSRPEAGVPSHAGPQNLNGHLRQAKRQAILSQVDACGGNLTEAARRLGIARSTLYIRLAEYGYRRPSKG